MAKEQPSLGGIDNAVDNWEKQATLQYRREKQVQVFLICKNIIL